jgi:hypothetical protein
MDEWNRLLDSLNSAAIGAFGRELSYHPVAGEPFPVQAIFEATRESEDAAPGVYAAVFLRSSALPTAPQRGDRVVVDDTLYTVFDIEADHGGGLVLRLRRS